MKNPFSNMRTTIRLTVITVFVVATTLTVALAIGLQYYFGQSMARQAATNLYTAASSSIAAELTSINRVNTNVIDLLADSEVLGDVNAERAHLEIFTKVLEKNPLYYAIYLGRGDGGLFEVINLDISENVRQELHAMPTDRWLIITVRNRGEHGSERHYDYLDAHLQSRFTRSESTEFDARSRPWYLGARASSSAHRTDPYLFALLGVPGQTVSKRVQGSNTVVATDMTLSSMSQFLSQQQLAGHADVYLYNGDGQVIASSLDDVSARPQLPVPELILTAEEKQFVRSLPPLLVSNEMNWAPIDYAHAGQPRGYSVDVIKLIAEMTGLQLKFINGLSWTELVRQFQNGDIDLLQSVVLTDANQSWGLAGSSYATLPFSLATKKGASPLPDLALLDGESLAIPTGWSIIPVVRARYPGIEIIETDSTLDALALVLAGEASAALDNDIIMRYTARNYFLDDLAYNVSPSFGEGAVPDKLHIMVAPDRPQLRRLIDKAITAIGDAQRQYLAANWLVFDAETTDGSPAVVPSDALIQIAANPALHGQLRETLVGGETFLAYAAPTGPAKQPLYVGILASLDTVVAPFLNQVKLSLVITAVFVLLLLPPMAWIFANPIVRPVRQLAVENEKVQRREYNKVNRIASKVKELDELSASMVSMVASVQAYELAQRTLMDSFFELIAQAIDDKSAYTGGHCARVPELAIMLARHASDSELPAFRDFRLETDDQWREYRVAAWLHDCGKITMPEHIVDKGSKLETIYNRIHEVRMRFEVLWRDAQIDYWRALAAAPDDKDSLAKALQQKQEQLLDDFNFIAECNVGSESLADDKLARLAALAKIRWQRHFDDRIGLSPVEELRLPAVTPALPAEETLLSDKPEHIVARTRSTDYPPEWGINMEVPEHLYNQGELYNLSVSKGTLTAEDRFKINEHMISTIKMLESLPFPEELRNVPRYASTHHETMRGSGYPRKLPGEQLSIPERLLVVADVFEALTASDRPYKKAKPVSVALDILYQMVEDEHIDRDCFELFIREKVYLQYARAFLSADQLDEVDSSKYLRG